MTDEVTITVKTEVKYRRLPVPDEVYQDTGPGLKQDGLKPLPTIKTADLPLEVLDALAYAWLQDFYAKANQRSHWRQPVYR